MDLSLWSYMQLLTHLVPKIPECIRAALDIVKILNELLIGWRKMIAISRDLRS